MWVFVIFAVLSINFIVNTQDNIQSICTFCGDSVNEYCCQYYNSCCDFINPSGCPPPTSPETRKACRNPIRCSTSAECPSTKLCCRTSLCGATCTDLIFTGYRY
ncbi:hypothetical protein ILUMI_22661 [Ignelater luminosus]|uniref:WAP domain-containing protein n=1 Tax=Ignelater luminosus TaxID=2038154 RepID=A0A8K0CFC2_IGNLU|nr:hypothetical protein ILUMI_22661 [Ignelater luminosus]